MSLIRRVHQRIAHIRLTQAQLRHAKAVRREACDRLAADVERRKNSEQVTSFRVRRKQALAATRGELA